MIEVPQDDYERALAVLSELADAAHVAAQFPGGTWLESRMWALAEAFERVARIRPRRERTIESDLEEDR